MLYELLTVLRLPFSSSLEITVDEHAGLSVEFPDGELPQWGGQYLHLQDLGQRPYPNGMKKIGKLAAARNQRS